MRLFWSKGYHATSIQDLVDHLGLSRSSIYSTFGSKEELFWRAIQRFDDKVNSGLISTLVSPGSGRSAIIQVFSRLLTESRAQRARGCMITNSLIEFSLHDPAALKRLAPHLDRMEAAFRTAAERGQRQGDVSRRLSATKLAGFLHISLHGLRAVAKARRWPESFMKDQVQLVLRVLEIGDLSEGGAFP
jgi:TetR/AcrR family transcriptional regulator, transcriptional repressor for nem operon